MTCWEAAVAAILLGGDLMSNRSYVVGGYDGHPVNSIISKLVVVCLHYSLQLCCFQLMYTQPL